MLKELTVYDDLPVMVHSIDDQGKILYANNCWCKKLGYQRDEVIGKKSTEFLTKESQEFAKKIVLPEFYESGMVTDVPYQFVSKSQKTIYVLLSGTAKFDENGNYIRSLAVSKDITSLLRFSSSKKYSLRDWILPPDRLHKKLVEFRNLQKVTQEEMSEIIGVSTRTYQRLEQGSERLSLAQISTLCRHFHESPFVFFFKN